MKDIRELTMDQLKAAAYDELRKKEVVERNLRIIVAEVDKREKLQSNPEKLKQTRQPKKSEKIKNT